MLEQNKRSKSKEAFKLTQEKGDFLFLFLLFFISLAKTLSTQLLIYFFSSYWHLLFNFFLITTQL